MSYLDDIKNKYNLNEDNIYSIIVVGDNLEDPFGGWSGIVLKQVFGDKKYKLYFGDFTENLAAYENLTELVINRRLSKDTAVQLLKLWIEENVNGDMVVASSNAKSWVLPFIKEFKRLSGIKTEINVWDLKDMYSVRTNDLELNLEGPVFSVFKKAIPIPKTFGLRSIADSLSIWEPNLGEQPEYRSELTTKVIEEILS